MKVYIKPWEEALKNAKESDERLVDTVDGIDFILGILPRYGDWGHVVEAERGHNSAFDYYTADYDSTESFTYPACCVEEITPEWLEENANKFSEEVINTNVTEHTKTKYFKDYENYRITIYEITSAFNNYFFYVKRFSYNGYDEVVEEFREIK